MPAPAFPGVEGHPGTGDQHRLNTAVTIGKSIFQRYSQNSISKIMEALGNPGVHEIWRLYRANLKSPTAPGP